MTIPNPDEFPYPVSVIQSEIIEDVRNGELEKQEKVRQIVIVERDDA